MEQTLSDQPLPPTYIAQLSGLNNELSCEFEGDGFLLLPSNGFQSLKCDSNEKKNLNVCEIKTPYYGKCLKNYLKKEKTSWGVLSGQKQQDAHEWFLTR